MELELLIKRIEDERLFWAICRENSGRYTAVVIEKSYYIGDDLSGPGAHDGRTVVEALLSAFNQEIKYRAMRNG